MATQTLADWQKANPNYKVSYDSAKKMSTVTDPTGKSISFASGQANDAYGITGQIQNGSNVVDANKLMAALQAQASQGQQSQSMQPTQQIQTPSTYQTNASDMIEEQARQQMAAQAAAIQAARDKQVSEYNSQISQAPQTYQPLRNEASYAGAKNLQAANERMAAMGMYNSGDSVTAGIQVNAATQNNINALNLQEQNLVNQLKKAIADANESANSQILQSNSEINAQKLQALINQANADRDYNFQVDQTAYNRGQDALNRTDKINEAMGYVNPYANVVVPENIKQQLAPYANNYAAYAQANPNTELGNWANILGVQKLFANPDLLAKYGEKFKTSAQKAQDLQNEANQLALKYQSQIYQGQIDEQTLKNEYQRLVNQGYPKQQAMELAVAQANINQSNASAAAAIMNARTNQDQLAWAKSLNNPANQKINSNSAFTIDDWAKTLDNEFLPKIDSYGNVVSSGITNNVEREKRILGLGLPSDMTKALYQRYNIPLP